MVWFFKIFTLGLYVVSSFASAEDVELHSPFYDKNGDPIQLDTYLGRQADPYGMGLIIRYNPETKHTMLLDYLGRTVYIGDSGHQQLRELMQTPGNIFSSREKARDTLEKNILIENTYLKNIVVQGCRVLIDGIDYSACLLTGEKRASRSEFTKSTGSLAKLIVEMCKTKSGFKISCAIRSSEATQDTRLNGVGEICRKNTQDARTQAGMLKKFFSYTLGNQENIDLQTCWFQKMTEISKEALESKSVTPEAPTNLEAHPDTPVGSPPNKH